MALGCIALCANAQELEQKLSISGIFQRQGVIPARFINNSSQNFWSASYYKPVESLDYSLLSSVTLYDVKLNEIVKLTPSLGIIPITFEDGDTRNLYVPATQNLFDNDNAYEYIVPTQLDGDLAKGISIMQEDGKILTSISFEGNYRLIPIDEFDEEQSIKVYVLCDDANLKYYCYLSLNLYDDYTDNHITRIYSFEEGKISTSIRKVRDVSHMKVSTTLPQKNESINIDLSDMKSPNKLSVVDTNGKVCFTQSIQPNQTNVKFSTSGMPAGMYIIRVTDGNKEVDNCRVIIR